MTTSLASLDDASKEKDFPKYHNYSVSKRNELITTGRFDLSLNEQKILLILTSTIQPSDESFYRQVFRAVDLAKLLNVKPQAMYQELPKLTRKLLKCYIEVEYEGALIQANLLAGARYQKGNGQVILTLSEDLKPFYIQIKNNFTTYKLKYILRLTSKYSIRFYEFFQCYASNGTFSTTVEELLTLLSLTQKSYQRYADFNRKVLKPAVAEINELTDLAVSYVEIKEGRRVVGLGFDIKVKKRHRKKKSPFLTMSDEIKSILEGIQQQITVYSGVVITLEEAFTLHQAFQKEERLMTDAYAILNRKTENPVGALLDYLKHPQKYQHLIKPQLRLPAPIDTPETSPSFTHEESDEIIRQMKALQDAVLGNLF